MADRTLLKRGVVAVTTVGMIAGNVAAATLPLFGRSTAEISDRFKVLVTPAGYVFSIWGLIYLAMLALSAGQFFEPLKSDNLPDRIAPAIIVSNVANVFWLVLWHALRITLTVPVMLVLLGSLIVAYVMARTGRPASISALERWAVRAPLSLYLGWVSVATIANVSNALRAAQWDALGIPEPAWAAIVLLVGTIIAMLGLVIHHDLIFAGVFVWAFVGIAVEAPEGLVPVVAASLAAVIAAASIAAFVARRRTRAAV